MSDVEELRRLLHEQLRFVDDQWHKARKPILDKLTELAMFERPSVTISREEYERLRPSLQPGAGGE